MGPQAQEHLGLLKTGRGKNGLCSGAFKGKVALLTLYFQTSEPWENKQVSELRNIYILYTTIFYTLLYNVMVATETDMCIIKAIL